MSERLQCQVCGQCPHRLLSGERSFSSIPLQQHFCIRPTHLTCVGRHPAFFPGLLLTDNVDLDTLPYWRGAFANDEKAERIMAKTYSLRLGSDRLFKRV